MKERDCSSCGRKYTNESGGSAAKCPTCHARDKRGAPKPKRERRTVPVQVWFTPDEAQSLLEVAFHLQMKRAEWARVVVLNELNHMAAIKRLGLKPGHARTEVSRRPGK